MKNLLTLLLFACIYVTAGVGVKAADVTTQKLCIVMDEGAESYEVVKDKICLDEFVPVYSHDSIDLRLFSHSTREHIIGSVGFVAHDATKGKSGFKLPDVLGRKKDQETSRMCTPTCFFRYPGFSRFIRHNRYRIRAPLLES